MNAAQKSAFRHPSFFLAALFSGWRFNTSSRLREFQMRARWSYRSLTRGIDQHRYPVGARMRRDQIRQAVSIEVTHGQRNRIISWAKVLSGLKRAVSSAKQHREIMRAPVSYCEIRKPIAVEIG